MGVVSGGKSMPRKAEVEKQNWGVRVGNEDGWVITPDGGSATLAGVAAPFDRAAESVHRMTASVSDAGIYS
jgi:hypothetical protein